jgi:hypothetical protein
MRGCARLISTGLLVGLATFEGSCSKQLDVSVDGSLPHPVIILSTSGVFPIPPIPICLSRIGIYKITPIGKYETWRINSTTECIKINRVEYGILPRGFKGLEGPRYLESGNVYQIELSGPGLFGKAYFRVDSMGKVMVGKSTN